MALSQELGLHQSSSTWRRGGPAEVEALADEMVIVFRTQDISKKSLAALLLFQEAARRETALARNRCLGHPKLP